MSDDPTEMTLMDKVAFIKTTVTTFDLVDMLELEVVDGKIHSPYNEADHTPSCHLYDDHFYDFSTGNGGDVIDLMMKLSGCSWGTAVNKLAKGAQYIDAEVGRVVRPPVVEADLWDEWKELSDGYQPGLYIPGVPPDLILDLWESDQLMVQMEGVNGTVFIPHWHDGAVRGIKIRGADGRKTAVPGSQFGHGLYQPFSRWPHATRAVITEGESDCWAMEAVLDGQAWVCALPSGAGLWRDDWLKDLEQFEKIYTCFDNDEAGRRATEKVRRSIGWGRWNELKVPQLYNDAREAIVAGWKPSL